ncbi:MAG: hypothetical protein SGJ27_25830 [Candidatus Melainabacteria bacterium]|nr:hypothetical protein [Candidatus Melainabacteria bacterium]
MTVTRLDDTSGQLVDEEDSGIVWAVTFILLAVAMGFGIIMLLDQQSTTEYKIEKAFQDFRDGDGTIFGARFYERSRSNTISDARAVNLDELADLNCGSIYPVRSASKARYSHVQ